MRLDPWSGRAAPRVVAPIKRRRGDGHIQPAEVTDDDIAGSAVGDGEPGPRAVVRGAGHQGILAPGAGMDGRLGLWRRGRCVICGCDFDEAQAKRRRRQESPIASVVVQTCSWACEQSAWPLDPGPVGSAESKGPDLGRVVELLEVGGVHHRYERAAA